ncbi:zinc finger protein ZAT9-like [Telopea speciosissima]|uniref:zinc finger protein ZAT9-like n=1 Tax=Telopea speciosissima TaxID=54955 RepID=UPI001CC3D386|nr:zinc finger protein ZAT9-like [Telopea speciosissima]
MEKHSCKLCFKSFASGRALGGHMRSHIANLSTPSKTQQVYPHHHHLLGDETDSASSASSSSSSSSDEEEEEEEEEEKGLSYGLRENPKKSFRLVDPEFSFAVDTGSVVQDRESETESSKNPSRRRSKRDRKSSMIGEQRNLLQQPETPELKKPKSSKPSQAESPSEPEPVSSVSDTTPEEDVARCLMMLSRDIWMRKEEEQEQEQEAYEEEAEKSMEESDDSEELKFPTRTRGRYQCGTCKKVFRSYQALGGHRASHKKIRSCTPFSSCAARTHEAESEPGNAGASNVDRRIHECPVCFRVFGSGQALGGHKRSHLSGSVTAINTVKFGDNLIDLNLPAPVDEDDMSQVELSAVSDAEFIDPTK